MLPKRINEIALTVETVTDNALPRQDRDETTTFPTLKNLNRPTSRTPPETATIHGLSPKFASQINPKTIYQTGAPVRTVAMKNNANIVADPTIPAVSAKEVSIMAKLPSSDTNAAPDAKS